MLMGSGNYSRAASRHGRPKHPGRHFISGDIHDFDHAFFKFSKSQAAAIDPQQKLLIEENGGISRKIYRPEQFIGLSSLQLLSSTGRCYPFDKRGKGYGRGEGVVMLILLNDAIRDRDLVRAVIRSTAVGQDGYTPQNITYLDDQAEADLARTAYARAGLQPEDVAYAEAHGTGTKAGDKEELEGIAEVFASTTKRSVPLYVGSIKGAIGHTEAVAGLAGLLKAISTARSLSNRAFASSELAFFLSLSSVSSIVGASAQASYNAGNALQGALADQEQRHSGKTGFLTINFGWIADAVLTANDETRQGALLRTGFSLSSSKELSFDAESLACATAYNGTIQSALFSQVRDPRRALEVEEAAGAEASAGNGQTFKQVISEGNPEAVADFISFAVAAQLARLISVDASTIDAQQGSILAMGLDSLVAVELRNQVMRQFGAPLPLAEKIATRSKKMASAAG
ncbi:MAG: hypothetical protein LQ343_004941 [Gyalolechia ehrenbergii]|nr:MAG: hypothetical protein LQ343_004941 [Gyalolechia ehrenbergii]